MFPGRRRTRRVGSASLVSGPVLATILFWGSLTTGLGAGISSQSGTPVPPKAPQVLPEALQLAQTGHCTEALPQLTAALPQITNQELRYHVSFAIVNCGMAAGDPAASVQGLLTLRKEFPDDPEVLYSFARIFAQLADMTAQELARRFPDSAQVAKLNAQALEAQRKWDEAIAAYRKILEQHPQARDVHFRIATILLDTRSDPQSLAEARKELEAEIAINPNNAAAHYVLGEVARRSGNWEEAARLFAKATELDAGFLDAYFALGLTLNALGRHQEAVAPLELFTKGVPDDPAGHYQLAIAYSRTGNQEAANRELRLQREAAAKAGTTRPPTARYP
ncbi:MAG: hypothetical protein Kow00109_19130 [Acidobacteriota bacterium]